MTKIFKENHQAQLEFLREVEVLGKIPFCGGGYLGC